MRAVLCVPSCHLPFHQFQIIGAPRLAELKAPWQLHSQSDFGTCVSLRVSIALLLRAGV